MSDSADGTSLGTWRVRDSTESSVPSRAIVEVLLSEGELILVGAGDPLRFPYPGSTELSQPTARRGQDRAWRPGDCRERPTARADAGRMTTEPAPRDAPDTLRPISSHADAGPRAAIDRGRSGQARSGMARNRASAAVNSAAQDQRAGRWSVIRRAERVSRPTRPNRRRRSVLAVTMPQERAQGGGGLHPEA